MYNINIVALIMEQQIVIGAPSKAIHMLISCGSR